MKPVLTRGRLALTLGLCFAGAALVCILSPLIGIETVEDIIADLDQALDKA